jgi:hypothetical protein
MKTAAPATRIGAPLPSLPGDALHNDLAHCLAERGEPATASSPVRSRLGQLVLAGAGLQTDNVDVDFQHVRLHAASGIDLQRQQPESDSPHIDDEQRTLLQLLLCLLQRRNNQLPDSLGTQIVAANLNDAGLVPA